MLLPPPASPRAEILVVDSDAAVRDVCTSMLHTLGYRAAAVGDTGTLAAAEAADVVLMDVEGSLARAIELLRALKRARPSLRVLVMSGLPSRDLKPFLDGGADGALRKPFRLHELDAEVAGAIA